MKNEFRKTIVLPYFDKYKGTILQTDASKEGFGAVILQDNNPVYYASRTLTSAEKNYQNLKRECMATVWGMEKFHYFLYGKHFILQTDQKPLVSIFRKHMIDVSPRIQRIAIRAWQYQFEPQYISGKMNVIADALSRVTPLDFEDHDVDKEVLAVNVLTYTAIEEREKTELLNETDKDAELQALKMVISKGWPKKRSSLAPNLQPYWNYRDELTIEDGILMKGQKIIIPTSLKQQYIDKIHAGHTGIGSCLKKAREFIFWVNYSKDIQEAVEKCSLCQEQQNVLMTNQRYVSEVPPHPWHTLGSDLFYHKQLDFLVVVDYFSKFLIVRKIPNSTSSAIIKELDSIFSEYGKPYLFCSDNGPCYTSAEFKIFLDKWKIEHRKSSPHYPQSNGLAESMVKVSKHLIDKATLQGLTWNHLLLDYRCTPISSSIPSPVEILFGRKFHSELMLPSQVINPRISSQREMIARKEGKFHPISMTSNNMIPYEAGQRVWIQDPASKKWNPGSIKEKATEPNSYWVELNGAEYRQNTNFIKPRQTQDIDPSSRASTEVHFPTSEASASGPATIQTSSVDAIPTEHMAITTTSDRKTSTTTPVKQYDAPARVSFRSNKRIAPRRYGFEE